jgi:hypothetical protein
MDDLNPGAEGAPEADDLRAQIVAAMNGGGPETPEATTIEPPTDEADPFAADQPKGDKPRDDKGRFAPKQGEATEKPVGGQEPAAAQQQPQAPKADPAQPQGQEQASQQASQAVRPPPGWSPASKAAFDTLPDSVKADIAKREDEINRGFAKLAEYKGLEPYAEEARRNGVTVTDVYARYRQAEHKLQTDFVGGITELCQYFGVHPAALGQALGGRAPAQPASAAQPSQGSPQPDLTPLLQQHIAPLQQVINGLVQEREQERQRSVTQTVEQFFNDPANRYADNVADQMIPLLKQGMDLKSAYDAACWQHPEVRQQLINEQIQAGARKQAEAAAQAKRAAKSITGAPGQGAIHDAPAPSLREELERQFAAQRV